MARFRAARYDRWFDQETMKWRTMRVTEAFGDSREEARGRLDVPTKATADGRQVRIIVGSADNPLPSIDWVFRDRHTPGGRMRDRLARFRPHMFAPRNER